MVNVRFRGVELEESAKSEEARRRNPAVEAERELLDTVGEAYIPDVANIGWWFSVFFEMAFAFLHFYMFYDCYFVLL